MGSSFRDRLLTEAKRFNRVLALEKIKGSNCLEGIAWQPNTDAERIRGSVFSAWIGPAEFPGFGESQVAPRKAVNHPGVPSFWITR